MKKFSFKIPGNQEDVYGNPIGYTRVISHMWRADSTRYMDWQEYVKHSFYLTSKEPTIVNLKENKLAKPFKKDDKTKYSVGIKINWKDGHHADLDNVLKGILDALFENDRHVVDIRGSCRPSKDKRGMVEVDILEVI